MRSSINIHSKGASLLSRFVLKGMRPDREVRAQRPRGVMPCSISCPTSLHTPLVTARLSFRGYREPGSRAPVSACAELVRRPAPSCFLVQIGTTSGGAPSRRRKVPCPSETKYSLSVCILVENPVKGFFTLSINPAAISACTSCTRCVGPCASICRATTS